MGVQVVGEPLGEAPPARLEDGAFHPDPVETGPLGAGPGGGRVMFVLYSLFGDELGFQIVGPLFDLGV